MNGKGIFIWKAVNTGIADLAGICQALLGLGLNWVAIKIGDAASLRYASFGNSQAEAVRIMKQAGLKVWGWHYVYGGVSLSKTGKVTTTAATPSVEAEFAKSQVAALDLDGYIIDAEREYKVFEAYRRAEEFAGRLRGMRVPIALASYRFPSLHGEFPFDKFLRVCDLHMPQVYWGPGKAVSDLDRSIRELTALKKIPVCPLGRAYIGDGHSNPLPSELTAFMQRAKDLKLLGCSFWALDFLYLHAGGAARAEAIRTFEWIARKPWAESITDWARSMGYLGPDPEK